MKNYLRFLVINKFNKLAIGTAQFGFHYGINNIAGKTKVEEVSKIIEFCIHVGINCIDTAANYGEAEKILGKHDLTSFDITTKLSEIPNECRDVNGWIQNQVFNSAEKLNLTKLDCLLLHQPIQLLGKHGDQIFESLMSLKSQNVIAKFGISIYSPQELAEIYKRYNFNVIQAPVNVVDRRFEETGWLDHLQISGTEFQARSIFLQGLLLQNSRTRKKKFHTWNNLWNIWENWLVENNQNPLSICLNHVLNKSEISKVLIGFETLNQLITIVDSISSKSFQLPTGLSSKDEMLLHPYNWNII